MEVNDEMVDKLASLAKLQFAAEEKEQIKADLRNMIGFIQKMDELNTDDVEPLLHITKNVNVLRADDINGSITNEEALKNAESSAAPYFTVPKVIRKN